MRGIGRNFAGSAARRARAVHRAVKRYRWTSTESWILKRFARENSEVFFVQVGSNDGLTHDPLRPMILRHGWCGILVEPVAEVFERLRANYEGVPNLVFENAAISDSAGVRDFYFVERESGAIPPADLPYWHDQIGSFDPGRVARAIDAMPQAGFRMSARRVRTISLSDLLERHAVGRLDLLHVDAEGHDLAVMRTLDFSRYRPQVIMYEHKHLDGAEHRRWKDQLAALGYGTVACGPNTIARAAPPGGGARRVGRGGAAG